MKWPQSRLMRSERTTPSLFFGSTEGPPAPRRLRVPEAVDRLRVPGERLSPIRWPQGAPKSSDCTGPASLRVPRRSACLFTSWIPPQRTLLRGQEGRDARGRDQGHRHGRHRSADQVGVEPVASVNSVPRLSHDSRGDRVGAEDRRDKSRARSKTCPGESLNNDFGVSHWALTLSWPSKPLLFHCSGLLRRQAPADDADRFPVPGARSPATGKEGRRPAAVQ